MTEQSTIRSLQWVSLSSTVAMVVLVTSSGVVHKPTMEVPDVGDDVIGAAASMLAGHLLAAPLTSVDDPAPKSGTEEVDSVVEAALDVLRGALRDQHEVYVDGASHMAEAFDAVDTVRDVLNILEQQLVVVSLIQDVLDRGLNVAIGTETGVAPLVDCSIVVAPYKIEGEHAGTIGVRGPTRVNYPEALAAVALVSSRLGRTLSEG